MTASTGKGPALGPILGTTVVTDSLERVLPSYAAIGLEPTEPADWGRLAEETGDGQDRRSVWLAADGTESWLRLLEIPDAPTPARFGRTGWFSLEVATDDVHGLAGIVSNAPGFERLAGPAPLDVSEHIIAMQVAGPSSELYYFTEVQRALPPFDLHLPSRLLDRLFIAVGTVRSRADSLQFWSEMTGIAGLSFETRINILNRGLNLAPDYRMPVATMQLAAGALVEIDQIPATSIIPTMADGSWPRGIAQISLAGPGNRWLVGPDGERIEVCAAGPRA